MVSGRTDWVWTPERVDELREMWESGLSASQCAARLGSITRSGVLGKVNRMGLPRRREPGKVRAKYVAPKQKVHRLPFQRGPLLHQREPSRFSAEVWAPLPGSSPVPMLDVTGCRWPVSDPFAPRGSVDLFCGCEQMEGKPYCAEHAARAFTGVDA